MYEPKSISKNILQNVVTIISFNFFEANFTDWCFMTA